MMETPLDELLREFGFRLDDFPKAFRTYPTLLRYAERLPYNVRAEYLGALREFFCAYQRLNDAQRPELLEQFVLLLQEKFARKRWAH